MPRGRKEACALRVGGLGKARGGLAHPVGAVEGTGPEMRCLMSGAWGVARNAVGFRVFEGFVFFEPWGLGKFRPSPA